MLGPSIWQPIFLVLLQTLLALCLQKNSLTFVIDDTISMDPVIEKVKSASIKIMDLILEVKSSQIEDVVVVTFNDPDTKLWIQSRKRNDITEALSLIHAHTEKNNNPCPEYAMSGVYLGLNSSRPGSTLFVFTDSDAEDKHLDTQVIDLCQKTQSMVTFIIARGHCMPEPDYQLDVYYKVAKACSGKVMYLNPSEISEVFNWVNIFVQGEISILSTYDLLPSRWIPSTRTFTIDEQVEYVLITVTGQAAGLNIFRNKLSVYGKRIIWAENTKALQLPNPEPGVYQVVVSDHGHITIEIAGRTDFTFEHGFSQQRPKTMSDTTKQPIGDTNNYLSILVSDPSKAVSIKEVEILSLEDATLYKIPLIYMGENFYITTQFVSPNNRFKIAVNGIVKKTGRNISRTAKVPVEPQPKPKVIPKKQPRITISEDNGRYLETKYGESITLTCKVSAYPPPNIFWKDSSGTILSKKFSLLLQPYDYVSYLRLNSVTRSEQISCHAQNELLSTKKSINIKVNYFQIATQLPDITEARYGTSKTIKCDIRSQLPIRTRWYLQKDKSSSKDLLTASGSYKVSIDGKELIIVNVDKQRAGIYICEATLVGNEYEKETLHTELKVVGLEVPVIDKSRRLAYIFVNTSATIVCKVSKGTPKPKVTWQFNEMTNDKWVLLSSIGEELQIPNVDLTHSGVYKCVAENSEGLDQHNIKLIVHSRPVIKIDKNRYEVSGSVPSVRIVCNVSGYPPPAITWHEGENLITDDGNYTIYDGGLLIKNPKESESLNFICGASNHHGYAFEEFELTVYGAPKINKSVKQLKAFVNTSATINCEITNGIPEPKVSWQWRPKNSGWVPLSEIGEELQLRSVSPSQAGEYKCIAENREGIDHWETTLLVQSPPIIISNKTEYIGVLGDPYLRVACKVIGYPAPVITWRNKENVIIPGGNYSIDEGDLLITNPQEIESTFTCEASNEFGKVSKTFAVSVYYHLMDYGQIKNIFKKKDFIPSEDDKKLKCPLPYKTDESIRWFSVEWYYNDKKINDKQNVVVRPITGWGKYMCRANNVHGTIEKTITVKSRDCLIQRLDYTQNTPLAFVKVSKHGVSTLAWPKYVMDSAYYTIGANKTVTLSCTNNDNTPNYFVKFPGIYEIEVTCDHEDNFVLNGLTYKTSDLLCDKKVTATVVNTGEMCHVEGIEKLKIGFKASKFVEIYEACYDSKRAITHSVFSKEGTWGEVGTVPGYESYQYEYNCTESTSSCCFAKSQLLKAEVESYSSAAQLSTYIDKMNFNTVPEWRSCDIKSDAWDHIKRQITEIAINDDVKVVSGASYTSGAGSRPKYLWQLLIAEEEMKFAIVHVNDPTPVDEDILCTKPCEGSLYESLNLDLTDKYTYCCNADEYLEKFTPKSPNGNID